VRGLELYKKAIALIIICLIALNIANVWPVKAQSQSGITINADGSISPPTAPMKQNGNIYTLISDVEKGVTPAGPGIATFLDVKRDNIILNGNGHTVIVGAGAGVPCAAITVDHASNVTVENFSISCLQGKYYEELDFGIDIESASKVTVINNTITDTQSIETLNGGLTAGIYVGGGDSNVIAGNNLADNQAGIILFKTTNNLIAQNSITGGGCALSLIGSSNNTIYHNNFINNKGGEAVDSGSVNVWDDGYPSGGNYWSDYQTRYPGAKQIDSSGIGNTPYVIDSNNTDRYPLMQPFNSAFYALQTAPPKISVQSPLNQTYNDSSVSLTFSVNVLSPVKTVNWTGYSLDGEANVTVTGSGALTNVTIANVENGVHNVTVYANDTYGNMGASKPVTFTVAKPEPFPTALVATASGASAAAACLGLLLYFKKRKR
jgi:parallel beta-helix repeat protein